MSTRKGAGATRTRKPKHQNTFAFRHNPKSQKTAKILASVNAGLCASCHDKVEWRKRYRKYRPLRQPATCNDCHKKTITSAYHKICTPCARERRVCPWCCTKGRPRETSDNGEEGDIGEGGAEEGDEEPAGAEGKEVGNDGKRQAEAGGEDRGKAAADDDSMQQEEEEEGDPAGAGAAGVGGGGKSVAFASGSRNSDSAGAAGAAAGSGASDAVAMDDS